MGKRDMKNKTPPSGAKSQSLVLRLNTRLFFRQLGIFLCMDLLLVVLFEAMMPVLAAMGLTSKEADGLVTSRVIRWARTRKVAKS